MFAGALGMSATTLLSLATGLGVAIPLVTALGAAWMRTNEEGKKGKEKLSDYEEALKGLIDVITSYSIHYTKLYDLHLQLMYCLLLTFVLLRH